MWNIYDQPWTLLGLAGVAFLGVMTYRAFCPDKARRWPFAIPIFLAAAAFGLDFLVVTDAEKVRSLLTAAETAGVKGDMASLEGLISEDYRDSFHVDKRRLMERARVALANSPIKSIKEISYDPASMDPPSARVMLLLVAAFRENSVVAATYKPTLMAKLEFQLARQPDGRWLIQSIELVEIDKQSLTWGRTSGF